MLQPSVTEDVAEVSPDPSPRKSWLPRWFTRLFAALTAPWPDRDDEALEAEPTLRQRTIGVLLEAFTAVGVIAVLLLLVSQIDQNPLNRTSQVSGMAKIDLRFMLIGFGIIGGALLVERLGSPLLRARVRQMACAGIAALASALVAAGVLFALNGTPYGILAGGSDFGWIAEWIAKYDQTNSFPSHYPPIPIYLLWSLTEVTGQPIPIVTKPYEIIGTALYGPLAYFCWRTLLKPMWALVIGVVTMVPFIEPFKVYAQLILLLMIPILIKFLMVVRRSGELTRRRAAWVGAAFGAGFALLFLTYSGWFVWALPGTLLAFLVIVPWRTRPDRAFIIAGVAAAVFLPLTWRHLAGLLSPTGGVNDDYQYFDTRVDPAYIAMWRNDSSGNAGPIWPPLGEMGNVGLFSVLLVAGLAVALVLGWRRTPVITAVAIIAGSWLLRFYLAGRMFQTGQVRLYPRTTAIIMYLLLVLIGFAILYATQRLKTLYERIIAVTGAGRMGLGLGPRVPYPLMLAPLLMLFLFMGSATVDRLMPTDKPNTDSNAIWISHSTKLPDGTCPVYGRGVSCFDGR